MYQILENHMKIGVRVCGFNDRGTNKLVNHVKIAQILYLYIRAFPRGALYHGARPI